MGRYILKRVGQSVLILFCVSVIVFVFVNMAPGDPYTQRLDPSVSAEVREEMLTKMGYYDPIHVKFLKWIGGALRGDFGYSTKYKKPVWDVICERLPNTILMGVSALVLSTAIAIPAGKLSATRRNSIFDYGATILSFIGISIPAFFFGVEDVRFGDIDGIFILSKLYERNCLRHNIQSMVNTLSQFRYFDGLVQKNNIFRIGLFPVIDLGTA